jgi:hypothetical protein
MKGIFYYVDNHSRAVHLAVFGTERTHVIQTVFLDIMSTGWNTHFHFLFHKPSEINLSSSLELSSSEV